MEKAFDLKVLEDILNEKGLPVVEQFAEKVYDGVKLWIEQSVVVSETKIDDLVVPLLAVIDPIVKKQLDKIDKQEG